MTIFRPLFIFALVLLFQSCMIHNPKEEDCFIKSIEVVKISEGGVHDLVLHDMNGAFFYINRGLENGFTLENARDVILNKTVTLHIYESWQGKDSKHISQLAIDDWILYTEFDGKLEVMLNQ